LRARFRPEAGTDRDRLEAERDLNRLRRRDLRDRAVGLHGISEHGLTARGIVEIAVFVEREVAVTRVDLVARTIDVGQREEAVAVDGKVRVDAGGLQTALREVGVDRADLDAVADLLRVDAAQRRRRCRRVPLGLVQEVLERDILAFEADGAHVRDVVRNDVNLVLICR
jgi:hypothetical protein